MPALSVADLVKGQGECCARCKGPFTGHAGKPEEVIFLAFMHFALAGASSAPVSKGKLVAVCPNCAREIERESR